MLCTPPSHSHPLATSNLLDPASFLSPLSMLVTFLSCSLGRWGLQKKQMGCGEAPWSVRGLVQDSRPRLVAHIQASFTPSFMGNYLSLSLVQPASINTYSAWEWAFVVYGRRDNEHLQGVLP